MEWLINEKAFLEAVAEMEREDRVNLIKDMFEGKDKK